MTLLVACLLQAADLFPLDEGWEWTYVESDNAGTRLVKALEAQARSGTPGPGAVRDIPLPEKNKVVFPIPKPGQVPVAYEDGLGVELRYRRRSDGVHLESKAVVADGKTTR